MLIAPSIRVPGKASPTRHSRTYVEEAAAESSIGGTPGRSQRPRDAEGKRVVCELTERDTRGQRRFGGRRSPLIRRAGAGARFAAPQARLGLVERGAQRLPLRRGPLPAAEALAHVERHDLPGGLGRRREAGGRERAQRQRRQGG